jgi:hypothetical protein
VQTLPQGLKPEIQSEALFGTTEVVPFQNFLSWVRRD